MVLHNGQLLLTNNWHGSIGARFAQRHNESLRGWLMVVNGSIGPLPSVVLMPVSSRKQLFDLSTKVTVVYYNDARSVHQDHR